jgi:hypothetical protein
VRRLRATAAAVAALTLAAAGCAGVEIVEQPAGGFAAVAYGEDAKTCKEARERATAEARYHCEARGQRATLGQMISEGVPSGCRVELPFWCTSGGR